MRAKKVRQIALSLCTIIAIQSQVLADEVKENKEVEALDSVEVVSSTATEDTNSYTIDSMNTSTKLDLSIRETPQSVSVLTNEALTDFGIDSYQELLTNIAGVSISRTDERLNPTARGFTIDYYKIDGAPFYIDYSAQDFDMVTYDRVEIVRGANGLTTGAGNPGIGINFIRKKANSKNLTGNITVERGSWNERAVTTDISSGLNESGTIRGRLVTKHLKSDSFMNGYEKEQNTIYGVVDADINDSTYLSIGASYKKLLRDGVRWGGLPAYYNDGTRINYDRSSTITEDWTYWNSTKKSVFANFKHYLKNDISLNAAYTYERTNGETSLLYFFAAPDKNGDSAGAYGWEDETKNTMHNIDVNVNIPFELNGLKQEIIFGATYNSDKKVYLDAKQTYDGSTFVNLFNYSLPSISGTSYTQSNTKNEQKSLYSAAKFSLSDDLKLISGLRFTSFERKFLNEDKDNNKFNNVLPYVGLVFDLNENYSLYASYTSIFKSQDYIDSNGDYLDPIEGDSYETGIKGEYFDGRLNATFSIFRIEQDNVGEDTGLKLGNQNIYKQSEGVTSKGFEIDINGSLTDNLNMKFALAHFNAKDAEGNKFNTTSSRTTANLYTTYKIDKLTLGGGLQYKSKIYTDNLYGYNFDTITQKSVTLANAMAKYNLNKNTSLQFNINNIFDKKYYDGIGFDSMSFGDPRNMKLTLKYTF